MSLLKRLAKMGWVRLLALTGLGYVAHPQPPSVEPSQSIELYAPAPEIELWLEHEPEALPYEELQPAVMEIPPERLEPIRDPVPVVEVKTAATEEEELAPAEQTLGRSGGPHMGLWMGIGF